MRKSYWFLGHHQTILAGAADTEGRYDFAEGRFPAGTQMPPHVHRLYSKHFYVLEGELTVWAGRRKEAEELKQALTTALGSQTPTLIEVPSLAEGF
jgi:mannose-6-phosphate isomerase-like protein (cupin superfamily)